MEKIGVRELRQHASRYLARVAQGETIELTDCGRAVAPARSIAADGGRPGGSGRSPRGPDTTDIAAEPPQDYGIGGSADLTLLRTERE